MIAILLATYNSSKYIEAQIDSIINQTYSDWKIFLRDDGSKDDTINIIEQYELLLKDKIEILSDNKGALKSYLNFIELLKNVEADYYMFCDHDDVWLPNKLEISMKRMQELVLLYPKMPIVVHADMKVVDQELNVLSDSFWKYSRLLPDHCSFIDLACCNCVNGCTVMINNKAKEVSLQNVDFCLMHDALVAQSVAAYGGFVCAIKQPLVLYRQHIDNVIGAADVKKEFFILRVLHFACALRENIGIWKRARHIKKMSLLHFLMHKVKISKLRYQIA